MRKNVYDDERDAEVCNEINARVRREVEEEVDKRRIGVFQKLLRKKLADENCWAGVRGEKDYRTEKRTRKRTER